ncbi:unnamed protein product [Prunus brigantina]
MMHWVDTCLILRLDGEPIEIDVRYEKLPTACYRYGIIGHIELACLILVSEVGRQFGFLSSSGWSMPALKDDASSSAMVEDGGSTKLSIPNQHATNALQNLEVLRISHNLASEEYSSLTLFGSHDGDDDLLHTWWVESIRLYHGGLLMGATYGVSHSGQLKILEVENSLEGLDPNAVSRQKLADLTGFRDWLRNLLLA